MRLRGRIDRNHEDIRKGFESHGCSCVSTANLGDGAPDLMVGFRGENHWFEIKDELSPPSHRRLTIAELNFHARWKGKIHVIGNLTQGLRAIGLRT